MTMCIVIINISVPIFPPTQGLLAAPAPAAKLPGASLDYRDRYEQLTGKSLRDCPKCHQGHMICIETFLPGTLPRGPPGECL